MLAGFSSAWQAAHGNCVLVCSPTTEPRDANDGRERLMTLEPPPHLPEALLPLTEELHHHGMPWTAAVGCFGQHGMLGHEEPRPSLDLHRSSLFDMASHINRRHLHDALFARHRLPFDAGFFSSRHVMQAPYMQPGRKDKRFCNANKNHPLFSCQSCVRMLVPVIQQCARLKMALALSSAMFTQVIWPRGGKMRTRPSGETNLSITLLVF